MLADGEAWRGLWSRQAAYDVPPCYPAALRLGAPPNIVLGASSLLGGSRAAPGPAARAAWPLAALCPVAAEPSQTLFDAVWADQAPPGCSGGVCITGSDCCSGGRPPLASTRFYPPGHMPRVHSTYHPQAPTFKWGITFANIADLQRPPEKLSYPQQIGQSTDGQHGRQSYRKSSWALVIVFPWDLGRECRLKNVADWHRRAALCNSKALITHLLPVGGFQTMAARAPGLLVARPIAHRHPPPPRMPAPARLPWQPSPPLA